MWCVYTELQDTPAQPLFCAPCTQLLLGDASRQKSPTETTSHIKGVPLVEYDYKLLSHESTSPPRKGKRRSCFSLNISRHKGSSHFPSSHFLNYLWMSDPIRNPFSWLSNHLRSGPFSYKQGQSQQISRSSFASYFKSRVWDFLINTASLAAATKPIPEDNRNKQTIWVVSLSYIH